MREVGKMKARIFLDAGLPEGERLYEIRLYFN
jgi:hypothetical protein